jgi:hypothetical protein
MPDSDLKQQPGFSAQQIELVNAAVAMAEELVSNHYKMSTSQWLKPQYDVKTLSELSEGEILQGPFAQIIRYKGKRNDAALGTSTYDYYKICLQDHSILTVIRGSGNLDLQPFMLYVITHELIHIVRFSKFLQNFEARPEERRAEEQRVHHRTHEILKSVNVAGMEAVLNFFKNWHLSYDRMEDSD